MGWLAARMFFSWLLKRPQPGSVPFSYQHGGLCHVLTNYGWIPEGFWVPLLMQKIGDSSEKKIPKNNLLTSWVLVAGRICRLLMLQRVLLKSPYIMASQNVRRVNMENREAGHKRR